ncbi:MAG TPA: AAA family ATPase, partial [Nannocystaceae bacterium]|nr:AAA family ATPase [Nannocystaceae bacterium]
MPVRIKSLHIQGFKALADTTLHWHPRVNVIAGANNSGKTTVLEAMALWVEIYDRIVSQAGKSISKRGIQRGEWYLDTALVHYNEITSVRSPGFHDLFHRDSQKLTLTAAFSDS